MAVGCKILWGGLVGRTRELHDSDNAQGDHQEEIDNTQEIFFNDKRHGHIKAVDAEIEGWPQESPVRYPAHSPIRP